MLRMSKQYRRPLLTFYLPKPPLKGDPGTDFRTLAGDAQSPTRAANLDALLRDIKARQSMVRAVLEDVDDGGHLPFLGSRTMAEGQSVVLESFQASLNVQ